jgi:acetate kinase
MKILVINSGSSTIKYQLFDGAVEVVYAKGIVACIGEEGSYISHETPLAAFRLETPVPNYHRAFELLVEALLDPEHGAIRNISEVSAIGHRAVHGADLFIESTLITPEVIAKMEECVPLAPLHNPPNLMGIREAQKLFPGVPQVAVFDTSFHQTMPPKAYLYAIPLEYYTQHKIRKYGFHGTSCRYVARRAALLLGRPLEELKVVICHLGNGVTIAAVDGGRSIDTSIGFATFSGVMMGTRTGDIDPGLIFYLVRNLGMTMDQVEQLYYRKSGLLGVSGVSNDMRTITEQAAAGNERCQLALEMFCYRLRSYIGSYTAALNGLDAVVFTAGIGENAPLVRKMSCEGLGYLGLWIDDEVNDRTRAVDAVISTPDSRAKALVIATDEEKMIALDTREVVGMLEAGYWKPESQKRTIGFEPSGGWLYDGK